MNINDLLSFICFFQFRIGEFGKIRDYLSFCCNIILKLVFLSYCVLTKAKKNKLSVKTMHICFQQEKKNQLDELSY